MGIFGALTTAVTGLRAQSFALENISGNIANSQTTGYKTNSALFESLVTSSSSASSYSSGGVTSSARSNISTQGLLTTTTNATDIAIQGNGFFPVTSSLTGGSTLYTRNGTFSIDSSGYLVNDGSYLLGWRTDASGAVVGNASSDTLVPIDTSIAATSATMLAPRTASTRLRTMLPTASIASLTRTVVIAGNASLTVFRSLISSATVPLPPG